MNFLNLFIYSNQYYFNISLRASPLSQTSSTLFYYFYCKILYKYGNIRVPDGKIGWYRWIICI